MYFKRQKIPKNRSCVDIRSINYSQIKRISGANERNARSNYLEIKKKRGLIRVLKILNEEENVNPRIVQNSTFIIQSIIGQGRMEDLRNSLKYPSILLRR
jgi:hypothetical protein